MGEPIKCEASRRLDAYLLKLLEDDCPQLI